MAHSKIKMSCILDGLLRSELERAIYETALGRADDVIARRYLVEKVPQIDIAAELGYERSTVSRRLKRIIPAVERTARKLWYGNEKAGE